MGVATPINTARAGGAGTTADDRIHYMAFGGGVRARVYVDVAGK